MSVEIKTSGDYYYIIYIIMGIKKRTPSFSSQALAFDWMKSNNIKLWESV